MFNFISDMFFNSDPYQTETLLDFFFLNDAAKLQFFRNIPHTMLVFSFVFLGSTNLFS